MTTKLACMYRLIQLYNKLGNHQTIRTVIRVKKKCLRKVIDIKYVKQS